MPASLASTVQLIHGAQMPVLGFGTSPLRGAEAATAVRTAIETGYRLLDTAENYHNEDGVGRGIRDSGVDRAELFVTSKFNRHWHSVAGVQSAYQASLDRLGLDYLDLYLVHWPNPDQDHYVDAVRGLDALLETGALRAIGTSNFKPTHLQRVLDETGIVPEVNQIQLSPYATRQDSRAFNEAHQIVTESWSPIGAGSTELRSDPTINEIAARYGKSAAQIILRWHIQLGLVPIPRSGNPDRMAENFQIFDFSLADSDMDAISALDRGEAEVTDSDVFGH
jgi:2,5-diketo-D-gluconate reductase A